MAGQQPLNLIQKKPIELLENYHKKRMGDQLLMHVAINTQNIYGSKPILLCSLGIGQSQLQNGIRCFLKTSGCFATRRKGFAACNTFERFTWNYNCARRGFTRRADKVTVACWTFPLQDSFHICGGTGKATDNPSSPSYFAIVLSSSLCLQLLQFIWH